MMNSFSAKSTKFNSTQASQRLNKVDEYSELAEEKVEIITAAMAKEREIQANIRKEQWKSNEKERRFRDKYRWAEKQQKLKSGKSEGYGFSSIKAGLKRQDFLDTLHWSPANNAKVSQQPTLLADLVQKLLQTSSNPTAAVLGNPASADDDHSETSKNMDGHMNENDWQLATSRKVSQLRLRGSNTLSSRMNVDSFIDTALSEPTGGILTTDSGEDVTLTDLQSPKLIESRFGWSKVRRAVVAPVSTSTKISPVKSSHAGPSKGLSRSSNASSRNSLHGDKDVITNGAGSSSSGRPPLCFLVPASATHIRPKSAILTPSTNTHSLLTPVNEFVAVVRQEIARPKSSQGPAVTRGNRLTHNALPERPKTATFRITDTGAVNQQAERDMIEAMQSLHMLLAGEEIIERTERAKKESQIYDHYRGLLYHDPGRKTTWQGVEDLLSPPPYLHQRTEEELLDEAESTAVRTDTRWAGRTLNSHRPWSPTPESLGANYMNARGRGTRGSIQMPFGLSGSPKRSHHEAGLQDAALVDHNTMLDSSVVIVDAFDSPTSRPGSPSLNILPQIGGKTPFSAVSASKADMFHSTRSMSGLTELAPSRQPSSSLFLPQRTQPKLLVAEPTPVRAASPIVLQESKDRKESPTRVRPATASPNSQRRPQSKQGKREGYDRPPAHGPGYGLESHSSELPANQRVHQLRDYNLSNSSSVMQENSLFSMGSLTHSHSHAHRTRSTVGTRASSASSRRTPLLINLITRHPPSAIMNKG